MSWTNLDLVSSRVLAVWMGSKLFRAGTCKAWHIEPCLASRAWGGDFLHINYCDLLCSSVRLLSVSHREWPETMFRLRHFSSSKVIQKRWKNSIDHSSITRCTLQEKFSLELEFRFPYFAIGNFAKFKFCIFLHF